MLYKNFLMYIVSYCTYFQYSVNVCHSIESDFVTWKKKLWPTVCTFFDLDINATGR